MRFILQAAAAHAAMAGYLTAHRAWQYLAGRGTQPPGAGPARAERPGQHDPGLGEMGRPGVRRRRAADLRREDGDRAPQPGQPSPPTARPASRGCWPG